MNIKFGVFWKQNLGTIYKDNSITTLGKEADVDLNLSEVSSIHANFKVDGKNYTSIVYIVDIEKGLIRIPFTREVLSIGMHELELVAVMKNGDVIPSQTFTYNIVESLDNLEDITEETNYPILIQLLQDVNSKIAEIDDAIARIPSPEELKGDKGDKGEQGIQGERGLQGIQGIRGEKGEKGEKGDRGLQGIQGVKGEKGDKGERGERGLQGIQGNQGARGIQGEKGDKGETGVGLGFEWSGTKLGIKKDTDTSYTYVELKGAKGEQGAKGDKGDKGDTGSQGIQGLQGERGERGIQGEKGDTPSIAHLEQQISDKSKELDTKFNTLTAKQQQDAEVVTARDGEVSLHARLERDLEKGKIHFVDVEGSNISTESEEGYLENVEIHGNTWQDANNLSDIRSVGTKVEGQELYEIPVLSCGKNLFNIDILKDESNWITGTGSYRSIKLKLKPNTKYMLSRKDSSGLGLGAYALINTVQCSSSGCLTWIIHSDSEKINYQKTLFTTSSDSEIYLSFIYTGITSTIELLKELQIEESTQATPYEPYQEDKLTILSPTPLEKVGDVADRIVCKDGVWGVEKNVASYVFIGNEIKYEQGTKDGILLSYWKSCKTILKNKPNTHIVINSKLPYDERCGLENKGTPAISFNGNCSNLLVDVYSTNLNEVNDYMKGSILKYALEQPTFIPLPHDQQIKLRTFADRTHISFETEIEPTIKAQVPKSLGATVNTHTTQIDNLNKELDRVKKLEESTVSTITSSKAFTTIAETSNGYFEDVKVKGKTLVNIFNLDKISWDVGTTFENGVITLTNPSNGWSTFDTELSTIKPNTQYTLIVNLIENTTNELIYINNKDETNGYFKNFSWKGKNDLGVSSYLVTTVDDITNRKYSIRTKTKTEGQYVKLQIMLLEGDHTDKDISFFEGLKSVGQDSDEISVESVNENLFNGEFKVGTLNSETGSYVDTFLQRVVFKNNIMLKPNTTYTIKLHNPLYSFNRIYLYNVYGEFVNKVTDATASQFTFTTNHNGFYLNTPIMNVNNVVITNDMIHEISNCLQIEEGSVATSYIPRSNNKKQILYFNPTTQTWEKPILREWDSIEKHSDGKYYYHKRSGELVLNGSEKYNSITEKTNTVFVNLSKPSPEWKVKSEIICDRFVKGEAYGDNNDIECLDIHGVNGNLHFNIDKSKLSEFTEKGIKQWLQANPVTVVYQLAQEEVYECTNLDLITYNGETNLIVNSGTIQPRITLKVLSNVSNVVKLLQEKVSILENKFIKGLQQVLAGDMMSLAHLLYPEDFENNHEIQTLEL